MRVKSKEKSKKKASFLELFCLAVSDLLDKALI